MSSSFDRVRDGLEAREEAAAEAIFARFTGRLMALARTRLDQKLQSKIDPEDVMQSVYRSFFFHVAKGEFEFESWDALWAVLTILTLRKCGHQTRYFRAARRNVRREEAPANFDPQESSNCFKAIDREPQPEEAAALTETLESVMSRLDEYEQPILTLKLQGCTIAEIADQLHRTERSVRRLLEKIRRHVAALCENDDSSVA